MADVEDDIHEMAVMKTQWRESPRLMNEKLGGGKKEKVAGRRDPVQREVREGPSIFQERTRETGNKLKIIDQNAQGNVEFRSKTKVL
jgi:hypothetical protein